MVVIQFLLLILGLVILIKGADFFVKSSSSIAKRFNISQIVIGLTIVSFGTSAPELFVNVLASIEGSQELSIGNVVGSNIANILLILGVSGLIYPIHTNKNTIWREIPFALLAAFVLLVMANDVFFGDVQSKISINDGIILIFFFLVFLSYVFAISKEEGVAVDNVEIISTSKTIILLLTGLAGLFFGGKLIVEAAINIAKLFHVSEAVIGLTIVAVGTSLPELATSAVAAYRKNSDIAIGNVVGSNIFNIFFILGVSSIINPIEFRNVLNIDLIFHAVITMILFIVMFLGKKRTLDRWESGFFVLIYIFYITRFFIWKI